jgi:hypothetical protein
MDRCNKIRQQRKRAREREREKRERRRGFLFLSTPPSRQFEGGVPNKDSK